MKISEFQHLIDEMYGKKDRQRGVHETFVWFIEEVGELARAIHRCDHSSLDEEFADCLAWLVTLANLEGIDMEKAISKYQKGCYCCHTIPCRCNELGAEQK